MVYICKNWLHHYRFSTFNSVNLRFDFQSFSIIVCDQRTRGEMSCGQSNMMFDRSLTLSQNLSTKRLFKLFFSRTLECSGWSLLVASKDFQVPAWPWPCFVLWGLFDISSISRPRRSKNYAECGSYKTLFEYSGFLLKVQDLTFKGQMMKCMSTSWEGVKYYVMGLFCKGVTPPPPFDEFYGFGG